MKPLRSLLLVAQLLQCMLLFSNSAFGDDRSNKNEHYLELEESEDSSYGNTMIAVNNRSLKGKKDDKNDTTKKGNKDTKDTKKKKKKKKNKNKNKEDKNPNIIKDSSGSSCTSDLFVGTWDYADGCDGSAYRAVISCDDRNIDTCTYSEKRILDGIVDDACIWSGNFTASAMIYYDPQSKICKLGYRRDYIVVDKKKCVEEEQNITDFGLKAQFDLGDKTEIMSILFTSDGGDTYYNEGTPRQASEVIAIRHRNLQVMNINKRKNIIKRIQRRLDCSGESSNSLDVLGLFTIEEPKGIVELTKVVNLGETLFDLGPQFLKAIEMFFSTDCGGGFAAMNEIGIDFKGTSLEFLGKINLMEILNEWFLDTIGETVGNFILPQKICTTDDRTIAELGVDKGIDSCEFLNGMGSYDIWAMGGQIGQKGLCAAFSIPTLTFAFAQRNVIPVITLPLPARRNRKLDYGATAIVTAVKEAVKTLKVTFAPNVIVISLDRGISTPTRTELWDGISDPSIKMINGNFRFGGSGTVGFGFGGAGYDLKGSIEFDGSFLFDADYSGDGLEGILKGELIDMAFLIQGSISPKFEVFQIFELNFAEVFKGFSADLYVVFSGVNTQILIGCEVELNLGGICRIAPEFGFLCDILNADAVLTGTINTFLSKDGVGIRFGGVGQLKFNPNPIYDWFLDLIDYPEDGLAVGAEISAQIGVSSVICIRLIVDGFGADLEKFCTPANYGRGVGLLPGRVSDCPDSYTNTGLFCGRGTDDLYSPSIVADCPYGYTNNGFTCGRGSDDIFSPSLVADCPSGYTNIGFFCSMGADSYYAPSLAADCPSGYTNFGLFCSTCFVCFWNNEYNSWSCPGGYFLSGVRCYRYCNSGYTNVGESCLRGVSTLSSNYMTCPGGYFKSDITQRCGVNCPDGYTNTGEFCNRPVSTLGWSSFTCPRDYFLSDITKRCGVNCPEGYTNTGEFCNRPVSILDFSYMKCKDDEEKIGLRCFPGDGGDCYDDFELDSGLCYKKCDPGFVGLGPMCWNLDDFGGVY